MRWPGWYLALGANLGLPRVKSRQIEAARPPRRLWPQRKQFAVVAVKGQGAHRTESGGILRQPDQLVRVVEFPRAGGAAQVVVAHGIDPPSGLQLNASRQMNPILKHRGRLVIVLVENARSGGLMRVLHGIQIDRGDGLINVLATHVVVDRTGWLLHAAQEQNAAARQIVLDRSGLHMAHHQRLGLRIDTQFA